MKAPEWDETFLDEMMSDVRDAVLSLCEQNAGSDDDPEEFYLESCRSIVTITVRRESRRS